MKILNVEQVNIKNSVTWTACNDDSRSNYWRSVFLEISKGLRVMV